MVSGLLSACDSTESVFHLLRIYENYYQVVSNNGTPETPENESLHQNLPARVPVLNTIGVVLNSGPGAAEGLNPQPFSLEGAKDP